MSPLYATVSQSFPANMTSVTNNINCQNKLVPSLIVATIAFPSGAVGLFANVWLLWMLTQRAHRGTPDIYTLNLTVMNLIINVITIPAAVMYFLWDWDGIAILNVFILPCVNGQPLFMACICVDCYMAVVHPITYMNQKHSKYRLVTCGLVWVLSVAYGVFLALDVEAATSSLRVVPYIPSLPAIVFCDLSVLHALRKPDPSGRSDVHPQKQRALQIITNSLIVSVVAFLPPLVVFMFLTPMPLNIEVMVCYVIGMTSVAPLVGSIVMCLLHLHNMGVQKSLKRILDALKPFK